MKSRSEDMFMQYFRGVPTFQVARALNHLTPGIDWWGCTKKHMAECWADPRLGHESLGKIPLEKIWAEMERIKKEKAK